MNKPAAMTHQHLSQMHTPSPFSETPSPSFSHMDGDRLESLKSVTQRLIFDCSDEEDDDQMEMTEEDDEKLPSNVGSNNLSNSTVDREQSNSSSVEATTSNDSVWSSDSPYLNRSVSRRLNISRKNLMSVSLADYFLIQNLCLILFPRNLIKSMRTRDRK